MSKTSQPEQRHVAEFLGDLKNRMGWGAADPRYRLTEEGFRKALRAERRAVVEIAEEAIFTAQMFADQHRPMQERNALALQLDTLRRQLKAAAR